MKRIIDVERIYCREQSGDLTDQDIAHLWEGFWRKPSAPWWEIAARHAVSAGHYRLIHGRAAGSPVYLARFWLTPPVAGADGEWESANSVLLHYFARPDDDGALHSHPWSWFRTHLLCGSYSEERPTQEWEQRHGELFHVGEPTPGPREGSDIERRWMVAGDTAERYQSDLHRIAALDCTEPTWSLVTTGKRVADWFFHPAGEQRVPWREYLDRLASAPAQ